MNFDKKIEAIKNKDDIVNVFFEISNKIFQQQKSFVSIILSSEKNLNEIKNKVKYIEQKQLYIFNIEFLNKFNNELEKEKEKLNKTIFILLNQFSNYITKEIINDNEIEVFKDSIKNGKSIFSQSENIKLFIEKIDSKNNLYSDRKIILNNSKFENLIKQVLKDLNNYILISKKDLDKVKELNEKIIELWKIIESDYKIIKNKENIINNKVHFTDDEKQFLNLERLKTINNQYDDKLPNNIKPFIIEEVSKNMNKEIITNDINSIKEETSTSNILLSIKEDLSNLEKDLKIIEKNFIKNKHGSFDIYI